MDIWKRYIAELRALWTLLLKPLAGAVSEERIRDLIGVGLVIALLIIAPGLFFALLLGAALYAFIRATRSDGNDQSGGQP